MTLATDQQHYYRYASDPRIVTLHTSRKNAGHTVDPITWDDAGTTRGGASRMDLREARSAFGGAVQLSGQERVWNIPDVLLTNATDIQPGDFISEGSYSSHHSDSISWRVQNVTQDAFGNQWICSCIKAAMPMR